MLSRILFVGRLNRIAFIPQAFSVSSAGASARKLAQLEPMGAAGRFHVNVPSGRGGCRPLDG